MNEALAVVGGRGWQHDGSSRVPYWVYSDPEVYKHEQERIVNGPHWCYVALEAEIPNAGDFKRSWVGERSVIVVRDQDGRVNVVENHCAHRGAQFCQDNFAIPRSTLTAPGTCSPARRADRRLHGPTFRT